MTAPGSPRMLTATAYVNVQITKDRYGSATMKLVSLTGEPSKAQGVRLSLKVTVRLPEPAMEPRVIDVLAEVPVSFVEPLPEVLISVGGEVI